MALRRKISQMKKKKKTNEDKNYKCESYSGVQTFPEYYQPRAPLRDLPYPKKGEEKTNNPRDTTVLSATGNVLSLLTKRAEKTLSSGKREKAKERKTRDGDDCRNRKDGGEHGSRGNNHTRVTGREGGGNSGMV